MEKSNNSRSNVGNVMKYNSNTVLISKQDNKIQVKISGLIRWVQNGEIIALIKDWRAFTGSGIKDSKDKIESLIVYDPARPPTSIRGWDVDKTTDNIVRAFYNVSYHPELSKEVFIGMITDAINNMDKFHCNDMLIAVEFLFENIKKRGGLVKIAEENDIFLDSL